MPIKPLTAEDLIGRRKASFTPDALVAIKKQFVIVEDDQGRITSARRKVLGYVKRERALKKNARGWICRLPVLLYAEVGDRHWPENDLAFGYSNWGWRTYAEEHTDRRKVNVVIYNFHGTLCDQAKDLSTGELRKLRQALKSAGIRPLLWPRQELAAGSAYEWGGYAVAKTADGLYSICITARGGAPLSALQIYASPYPVQLIGLLPLEVRRLQRRMQKAKLKKVAWPACNASTARALSTSTVRVTRFAKGARGQAGEALATDTYHHSVDDKGRHRISLPKLGLEYEPMRLKGALELISRMKKDGLKPTPNSVLLDDYRGADS